jgi:hypothetical protein
MLDGPKSPEGRAYLGWVGLALETRYLVERQFCQQARYDQNAYIERFNRSDHTEVLNAHLFDAIAELRAMTVTGYGSTTANGPTASGVTPLMLSGANNRRGVSLTQCQPEGKVTTARRCARGAPQSRIVVCSRSRR